MTLTIALDTADGDGVPALMRMSDAFTRSLYPSGERPPLDTIVAPPNAQFFVARVDGKAVGCGVLVLGDPGRAELRRMFVDQTLRGQGIGAAILEALEGAAARAGVTRLQLESSVDNRDALTLYRRHGYRERGPFGSYAADPASAFMEKVLSRTP